MGLTNAPGPKPEPSTFTVLRITKLKSWGEIGAAGELQGTEHTLIKAASPDLAAVVRSVIGLQTIRSNAVLAVQVEMSLVGALAQVDLQQWAAASMDWLGNRYGERVVAASQCIRDGAPVLLAVLVPLDERGKLNARALFGGTRLRLAQLQREYAGSVERLGIKRGGESVAALEHAKTELAEIRQQLAEVSRDRAELARQLDSIGGDARPALASKGEDFRAELERRGQTRLVP
jgi:hypothetical protein